MDVPELNNIEEQLIDWLNFFFALNIDKEKLGKFDVGLNTIGLLLKKEFSVFFYYFLKRQGIFIFIFKFDIL